MLAMPIHATPGGINELEHNVVHWCLAARVESEAVVFGQRQGEGLAGDQGSGAVPEIKIDSHAEPGMARVRGDAGIHARGGDGLPVRERIETVELLWACNRHDGLLNCSAYLRGVPSRIGLTPCSGTHQAIMSPATPVGQWRPAAIRGLFELLGITPR